MKGLPYIKTGIYVVVVALFICLLFLMRSQVEHQPIFSNLSRLQDAHVEIERSIPQQIYPCLIPQADWVSLFQKRESIKAIKVLSQAKSEKTSFYYLNFETNLNSNWGTVPNSFQALVKLDKQRKCTRLYLESEYAPVSYYLPMPVARQLALKRLEKEVKNAGGAKNYEQELFNSSKHFGVTLLLSPEEIWAHQQLNIQIPDGYSVLSQPIIRG